MTSPSSNIVLLSSGLLSAYGLEPQALAKEIKGWGNVAETRLVRQWTLEQIGEIAPNHRFFLVGRGEPVPGLDARWFPVDLAAQMPWLGGDPEDNVKALVWAALAEADLEPDLERVSIEPYSQVLVMGQGPAAKDTVFRLAQAGVKVVWALPNSASGRLEVTAPPGVQILPCLGLSGLTGFAGRFTAALDMDKSLKKVQAGAVLLCSDQAREPLGGAALSSPQTITMSAFEGEIHGDAWPDWAAEDGFRLVFLAGFGRTSNSENMRRMMTRAFEAAKGTRATVYILAPQVKVADAGLERLYGRARESGVVFIRTPDEGPQIFIDQSGRVRLKVYDSLAQADLGLTPDRLVVEEALRPGPELEPLAAKLGLTLGPDGYLGPDNVLFLSASTNRRGVLALGPVRGTDSAGRLSAEIDAAVAVAQGLLSPVEVEAGRVTVTPGLCAHCLTCVRVCPHEAILFTNQPWADPVACAACGLCVAACPGKALELVGFTNAQIKARLESLLFRPRNKNDFEPRLVMFGCQRSALIAMGNARRPHEPIDLAMAPVPCGGRIDDNLVLKTLGSGADGIIIAVCHEDNCRTQTGSLTAGRLVAHLKKILAKIGCEPERLTLVTLAPNMGVEFSREVLRFRAEMKELGPNPMAGTDHD